MDVRHLVVGAVVCAGTACTAFGAGNDATGPGTADAGSEAGASSEAGGRFCPPSPPANTRCWDFDDGVAPSGDTKKGSTALDPKASFSGDHSLLVTVEAIGSGDEAWARLVETRANAPSRIHFEQRLMLDQLTYGFLSTISIQQESGTKYNVSLVGDGRTLSVLEQTLENNNVIDYHPYDLTTVSEGAWAHVAFDLETAGVGTPTATRKLRVSVDGSERVNDSRGATLEKITPAQTLVYAGISYVNGSTAPAPVQTVHLDDVLVRFEP